MQCFLLHCIYLKAIVTTYFAVYKKHTIASKILIFLSVFESLKSNFENVSGAGCPFFHESETTIYNLHSTK